MLMLRLFKQMWYLDKENGGRLSKRRIIWNKI